MKLTTFIFLILLPLITFSQEFSEPLRVNSDTTLTDREPAMHVGPNGSIYVSWIKVGAGSGAGDAYFSRSDDGGRSFIPSVRATMGAKIPADNQRGAPFAIDTKGNIHMTWIENRVHSQPDVWYIRSTDNGATWTEPISVSDDSSKHAQDFPSVACDSSGNIYLSFLDSRERNWGGCCEQLYMRKSTDNGITWTPARRVNNMPDGIGGTCECCKQDIQAGYNGLVTIAFRTNINNRRDVFATRSTDYGETFSVAKQLQTAEWTISACPVTGPNTFLVPTGSLHAAWRDARDIADGESHVYYTMQESDNAVEYDFKRDVSGEVLPNWPDIAVYSGVQALVYETNNMGLQYIVTSPHELPSFYRSQVHFNGRRQQFGNVQFGPNGDRYIVWQESRSSTNDIYFTRDTMPVNFGSVDEETASHFRVRPNPVHSGKQLEIILPNERRYDRYQLIDMLGRIVAMDQLQTDKAQAIVMLPEMLSGSYLLRLLSSSGVASQMILVTD